MCIRDRLSEETHPSHLSVNVYNKFIVYRKDVNVRELVLKKKTDLHTGRTLPKLKGDNKFERQAQTSRFKVKFN